MRSDSMTASDGWTRLSTDVVRDVPAHAPPPRPDLLLGHAPAAGRRSAPRRTRSTATCAPPTRSSTARAGRRAPRRAAPRSTRWEARARARAGGRALARTRSSARSSTPAAATGCRCGELQTYMRSMRDRLRAGADRDAGRSSRPTWTARPARSGASWRRCSACPSATTPASARLGLAFQLDELHPRRARGLGARPRLPARPRTARASASPRRPARRARLAGAARAARARGRSRARRCSRERRAGDRAPRPARCGRACASPCAVYLRVLDRVERIDFDVLGAARAALRAVAAAGARARGRCAR